MGALAHSLEREGLPTTQVTLVREHTQQIRPPRALWVPFDLGRPFGVPGDAAFQGRVLRAALRLLERTGAPVLVDHPEEAPDAGGEEAAAWACPIPPAKAAARSASLGQAFEDELARLLPWYTLATHARRRTTVGLSGLEPPALGRFLRQMLEHDRPSSPKPGQPLVVALKQAAEDLKAIYGEAVTAQPGPPGSAADLARWFWRETRAGELLREVAARCARSGDPGLMLAGHLLIVPHSER